MLLRLALLFLGISGFLVVVGYAALYFYQEKLIFFPQKLPERFVFTFPWKFGENRWDVPGAALSGVTFHVDNPRGVVLFFHGNAGNLAGWGYAAGSFLENGYDVVMPDYRGYGRSGGEITRQKEILEDAAVVYEDVLKKYPREKIILAGRSLGTGVALYLAARRPPKKLILLSPYDSLAAVGKTHYPWIPSFLLKYPMPGDKWIEDVNCPVVIFHGESDNVVPIERGRALASASPMKCRFVSIPGGDHENLQDTPLFISELKTELSSLAR